MKAVYKRELKSIFHSMIGWVFMAVILFFAGLYFTAYNLGQGYPYFAYALSSILFVLMIVVPVLTMRIMAEDKKQNTDQLLYTAPVPAYQIILGKYLSMLTTFLFPVLIVSIYPLFLSLMGEVPYADTYVSIFGFFVFGAACIAIGQFASSLTENQIVAAVLAFLLLFLGYMMTGISGMLFTGENIVTKILGVYSFSTRLSTFFDGVFDIPSFLYFLTLIVVFLFFTCQVIQKKRWSVATRRIRRGAFSTGLIVVVIAAAILVNYGVSLLPDSMKQFDVTNEKLYQISEQTEEMLGNLSEDITIYVLADQNGQDTVIEKTLAKYEAGSNHITVVYKDPSLYPEFAGGYAEDSLESNSLIVESQKRYKVVSYGDLYESDIDYTTYTETVTGYDGEGQLTSAIAYVTSEEMPKLYEITGHGELALSGGILASIQKENVDIESINLLNYDAIPEDAAGILVLAPTADYTQEDAQKISDYLDNGGKAIFITSWTKEGTPVFTKIFEKYGLTLADGVVVDSDSNYYYQNPYYLLPDVNTSAVSSSLVSDKRFVFMPYAQGIVVEENEDEDDEGPEVKQILVTSDKAYAKTDVQNMQTWEKEDGDANGPFALGVYVTQTFGGEEMKFLWLTSENFISDDANATVSGANFELITNMIGQMSDQETSISIPVKEYTAANLTVPRSVFFIGGATVMFFIPVIVLVIGLVIWLGRRKK